MYTIHGLYGNERCLFWDNVIAVGLPQLKDSTKRRTIDSHFLKEKICRTKVRDAASCQGHVCSEEKRVSYHIAFIQKKGRVNNKTCNK